MLFSLTPQCFGVYLHITGGLHELHSFSITLINPKISPFSTTGTFLFYLPRILENFRKQRISLKIPSKILKTFQMLFLRANCLHTHVVYRERMDNKVQGLYCHCSFLISVIKQMGRTVSTLVADLYFTDSQKILSPGSVQPKRHPDIIHPYPLAVQAGRAAP